MTHPDDLIALTEQPPDTIHHVLRSSRRRLAVVIIGHNNLTSTLAQTTETGPPTDPAETELTTRSLARQIAAIEGNTDISQATGSEYHNCYVALCQTHLPLLDEVGAIQYDADRKTIRPGGNLVPLAIIATISSNIAQMIFHDSIARLYTAGETNPQGSIGD